MQKILSRFMPVVLVTIAITLSTAASAQNWKELINEGVGLYAAGPVTADSSFNLYGVNSAGGPFTGNCYYGCGQVYEFSPNAHKLTSFPYNFTGLADGSEPYGKVIFDASGNLYGVTLFGGNFTTCYDGCGVVYELAKSSSGWTQTVLYTFQGGNDGISPSSIIFDGQGNLFGVTRDGGGNLCWGGSDCGVLFELSPTSGGGWTETILHTFTGLADGGVPINSLLLDQQGNLYGATIGGGNTACTNGCGVIFELSPTSSGWNFSTIYSFDETHGADPQGSLVMDGAGNLYGNANAGGRDSTHCYPPGCGVTFKLSPGSAGWTFNYLHSFSDGFDGGNPNGGLLLDTQGNLYGSTYQGGSQAYGCENGFEQGCGVIFKLSPSGGKWIFDRLYTFQGSDGFGPYGSLIADPSGNLYGTTVQGDGGYGNIYELVPPTQ